MVTLHLITELDDVLFSLGLVVVKVLLFHAKPFISLDGRFTESLLDQVVSLKVALLLRYDDVVMELISLPLNELSDGGSHPGHKEVIEL